MTASQTTSLTFEAAQVRLGVFHEILHPWLPRPLPSSSFTNPFAELAKEDTLRRPLLRLWDFSSGSQPDNNYRMLARDDAMELYSEEQRRSTLTIHLNHKEWIATPYISFSSSPTAIEDLAEFRETRRRSGRPRLVAINPQVRLRKRLPILSVEDEMKYYRIRDPYGGGGAYYENHYVCLWEIAPDEVIGDWDWHQLEAMGSWYEGVVLPAFLQHEEVASALSAIPLGCEVIAQQPENHSDIPEVAQLFAGLSSKLMSFHHVVSPCPD
jgi:hypothetical protein